MASRPVVASGEFPYDRVLNDAKANGLEAQFDSLEAITAVRVEKQDEFLRTHTLLEALAYMNADSMAGQGVAEYYSFVAFGEPYEPQNVENDATVQPWKLADLLETAPGGVRGPALV